jgi:hypothetical protein
VGETIDWIHSALSQDVEHSGGVRRNV